MDPTVTHKLVLRSSLSETASSCEKELERTDIILRIQKTRTTPEILGGVLAGRRVGRCWGISEEKKIAFLMAAHPRLGVKSA